MNNDDLTPNKNSEFSLKFFFVFFFLNLTAYLMLDNVFNRVIIPWNILT